MTLHDNNPRIGEASNNMLSAIPPAGQPHSKEVTKVDPVKLPSESSGDHDITGSVSKFVAENPGPSLLIGAGLAWLFVNRERTKSRALPSRLKDKAVSAKETTGEKLSSAAATTTDSFSSARHTTSLKLNSMKSSVQDTYFQVKQDNPLALGAAAIAVGLTLGLLLPSTQSEDELMGEHRDSLMDQARRIVDEARIAALSSLKSSKEDVAHHLEEAKHEVKDAIDHSAQEAKEAAKDEYYNS